MLRILRFHIQGFSLFFPNWVAKLLQDCASDRFSTPLAPSPSAARRELPRTGVCMSLPLLRPRGDTLLKRTSAKPGWEGQPWSCGSGPRTAFPHGAREPQPGFYAGHCGGTLASSFSSVPQPPWQEAATALPCRSGNTKAVTTSLATEQALLGTESTYFFLLQLKRGFY